MESTFSRRVSSVQRQVTVQYNNNEFDTSLTLGFKLGLRRTLFRFAQQQTVFHFSMIKTSFFTLQCTESKLKQILLRRVHVQKGNYVKVWRSQHPEEFKLLIYSTNINFNSKTIPSLQTDRSDSLLLYINISRNQQTNKRWTLFENTTQ